MVIQMTIGELWIVAGVAAIAGFAIGWVVSEVFTLRK